MKYAVALVFLGLVALTIAVPGHQGEEDKKIKFKFQYAAPFICGMVDGSDARLINGEYATTVQIHNPEQFERANIRKKIAVTFPAKDKKDAGAQVPGQVSGFLHQKLDADEAIEVDCGEIFGTDRKGGSEFFSKNQKGFDKERYAQGYVVIESDVSLDVDRTITAGNRQEEERRHNRDHKKKDDRDDNNKKDEFDDGKKKDERDDGNKKKRDAKKKDDRDQHDQHDDGKKKNDRDRHERDRDNKKKDDRDDRRDRDGKKKDDRDDRRDGKKKDDRDDRRDGKKKDDRDDRRDRDGKKKDDRDDRRDERDDGRRNNRRNRNQQVASIDVAEVRERKLKK